MITSLFAAGEYAGVNSELMYCKGCQCLSAFKDAILRTRDYFASATQFNKIITFSGKKRDKNSFRSGRQVFSRQFMNNYRKEIWALVQLIRRIEPIPNVSHLWGIVLMWAFSPCK